MSVFRVLDKLEEAIHNSPKLPLFWSDRVLLKREKVVSLIERTRNSLPEEMKKARWISKENQKIIDDSRMKAKDTIIRSTEQARDILREAQEQDSRLLDENDIVIRSKEKGLKIIEEAAKNAKDIREKSENEAGKLLQEAQDKSKNIINEAKKESQEIKKQIDEYSFQILNGLEREMNRLLTIIEKAKNQIK